MEPYAKYFYTSHLLGHRPGSLLVNQLVSTSVVCLLDDVRPFPLRLELPLRLVGDDDGASEYEHEFAFPEDALLDELVVGPHHVAAV